MQPFGSRSVPILGADFRDGHFRQLSTIKFSQIQNKQNCQPTLHGTKNKIKAIQLYQPKAKLFPRSKGSDEMADQDTAGIPSSDIVIFTFLHLDFHLTNIIIFVAHLAFFYIFYGAYGV